MIIDRRKTRCTMILSLIDVKSAKLFCTLQMQKSCENRRPPSKTKIAPMNETNLWPVIMVVKGHCSFIFDSAFVDSNCISEVVPCTYFFVMCLYAWCRYFLHISQRPGSNTNYGALLQYTALIYVNTCCTISAIDVR